ncbi:MAG TPA: hypothetical protein PKD55_05865 [Bellilinea sp.]|nr:hypothetical protein [Bellilinea sp.]
MDRTAAVVKQIRAAEAQAEAVQDLTAKMERIEAKLDRLISLLEAQGEPTPPEAKAKRK